MSGSGAGHDDLVGSAAAAIVIDDAAPYGYRREAGLQQRFEAAAAALLASDGWSGGGTKELVADLALEGGGVKGIGIVGAVSALAEAGYRFQRVAGTSAGAIAATLIAAISKKGDPMTTLRGYLDNLTFTAFMPQGKVHAFLDHHFGNAGEMLVLGARSSPTRPASTTAPTSSPGSSRSCATSACTPSPTSRSHWRRTPA